MGCIELRGKNNIFRTDIKRCFSGRHIGYLIHVFNISEEDEQVLIKNNSHNFVDVDCNLSSNLRDKIKSVAPRSIIPRQNGSKFNFNFYLVNPDFLPTHIQDNIYRFIDM